MNRKLLIVDNINTTSKKFLSSLEKNRDLYKQWDICFCSKNQPSDDSIKYCENLQIADALEKHSRKYKHILVIKSSDVLIGDFDLDLLAQVVEFPVLDNENCVQLNADRKNSLFTTLPKASDLYYKILKGSVFSIESWKYTKLTYQYVDYLFVQRFGTAFAVDYVFPYVNANDETWYKNYIKYKGIEASKIESANAKDSRYEKNYSTGMQRFRDSGLMKYVFRSIEKNLKFINKVHMLVASKSQVPDWVDTSAVDIITHDEFMPEYLLPTFSSSEIEMFLPKIPRVAEHFIYGNDDEFIMKPQKLQHWFFNGKPVSYSGIRPMVDSFTGDVFRHNDMMLVAPEDAILSSKCCLAQQHCPQPYLLSEMKSCYDKYEKQILASCTRFREDTKNFNQWIFLAYNQFNGNLLQKKRMCLTLAVNVWNKDIDLNKYTCVCINDSNENIDGSNMEDVLSKMNSFFPNKSRFEL